MPDISINSDLTLSKTKLMIDGKDVTKKTKVVGISFYASSPVKGEGTSGWIDCSITTVNSDGTVERKSYRKSKYEESKLPMGVTIKDMIDKNGIDNIDRYIGETDHDKLIEVADKIIEHCKTNNIKCPAKDTLYKRSINSLKDKAIDLGINLEG